MHVSPIMLSPPRRLCPSPVAVASIARWRCNSRPPLAQGDGTRSNCAHTFTRASD
jgi:hypothetical protein